MLTQAVTSKQTPVVEISQDLQLEGEKTSTELDISPVEPAQAGHSTDGNGTGAHGLEGLRNYPDRVLILFGTVTGNAEALAQRTGEVVARHGYNVRVKDMAHYAAAALSQESCVFIITSTYGNGEPPDDVIPFWEAVVHGNGLDLHGLKFSVLALGNTTYDHFCRCGRDFDLALERHGATRFTRGSIATWITKHRPSVGRRGCSRACSARLRRFCGRCDEGRSDGQIETIQRQDWTF